MKKLFLLITLLLFSLQGFCQERRSSVEISRIVTTKVNNSIQVDIFFPESIDPRTITTDTILINDKPLSKNTKITFNREGTQIRFLIELNDSFSLRLENVKTNLQKLVSSEKILLTGEIEWKKS